MDESKKLTNEVGAPISDNKNSITTGPNGLADKEYGERFAAAMGLELRLVTELSKLDNNGLIEATLKP